jgi:hypothetical protein
VLEVLSTVQRRAMLHTLELKVGLKKHRFKGNTKRPTNIFNCLPVASSQIQPMLLFLKIGLFVFTNLMEEDRSSHLESRKDPFAVINSGVGAK